MQIEEHVPLAPLTTFCIGGLARYFATITTEDELREALLFARERSLQTVILGGGSNVLVADEGCGGLVLKIEIKGIEKKHAEGNIVFAVGAGESWDRFVQQTIGHGLYGLVNLSGIPGTVGGAVVANAGAYGAQCSDTLVSVDVFDRAQGTIRTIKKSECRFSYHDSIFGHMPERYIVLRASFALPTNGAALLSYRDARFNLVALRERLGHEPTPQEVRMEVLLVREQKGYLVMDGYESYKNAGSFFHMPFVSPEQYQHVIAVAQALDKEKEEQLRPWAWAQQDGSYKLAPGFLLEFTEFQKGYRRGEVGISHRHILSIVNCGTASAHEVAMLAEDMQQAVATIFNVHLVREVEYVGNI